MGKSYLTGTVRRAPTTNRLQIATLVADLSRSMALLTAEIEQQEKKRHMSDFSNPHYPLLARTLRVRRANIEATIASLEGMVNLGSKPLEKASADQRRQSRHWSPGATTSRQY
jgi:hypothetical protein